MKGYTLIPHDFLELDLTITETLCLSVIWGFSQDGDSDYHGSQTYLAKLCKCSRQYINKAISRLLDLNLIVKTSAEDGKRCQYVVNRDTINTCQQMLQVGVNKYDSTCQQRRQVPVNNVDTYNIDNNIINTIDNIKRESIERKDTPFSKPSINEIQLYCDTQGLTIDVQHFYDYYESNGWKVGANKMKDWRAAARNWARRESSPQKESVLEHNLKVMAELKRRHNG